MGGMVSGPEIRKLPLIESRAPCLFDNIPDSISKPGARSRLFARKLLASEEWLAIRFEKLQDKSRKKSMNGFMLCISHNWFGASE